MEEKFISMLKYPGFKESVHGYDSGINVSEEDFEEIIQLADYLNRNNISFDRIMASFDPQAKRIVKQLSEDINFPLDTVWFDPELSFASLSHIIPTIEMLNEDIKHLLLVVNEVSIAHMGEYLTGGPIERIPLGALVCYEIDGHSQWCDIQEATANQKFLWKPSILRDG